MLPDIFSNIMPMNRRRWTVPINIVSTCDTTVIIIAFDIFLYGSELYTLHYGG